LVQFSIDGKTKIYGIIGQPVSHSFSPGMHTQAFQQLGLNAVYLPFPLQENQLPQLFNAFSLTGVQGFNVTVPYKEKIIPYLDQVSKEAQLLGSVNTVMRTAEGWWGTSTDGAGFVRSLQEEKFVIPKAKVLLLGAGGSAKAVALALVEAGIHSLHIMNRTAAKAQLLTDLCRQENPALETSVNPAVIEAYDLLVNCTSIGMEDASCPASDELIQKSRFIIDIIYNPVKTTLLHKAEKFNIAHCNGLGMLLHQGVAAFEIWTKQRAPVEVMKKSLLHSLRLA